MAAANIVEVVGVVVSEAANEVVEEEVNLQTEVRAVKVEEVVKIKIKVRAMVREIKVSNIIDTKPKDTLTYLHLRHVSGTGPTGSPRTSAWSPAPAPGRTSGPPKPTIEGPANPTRRR